MVAREHKRSTLYLEEEHVDGVNAVTGDATSSTIWRQRLGHISVKRRKMLGSKGKIPDLKKFEMEFYEQFLLRWQRKVSFVKSGKTPRREV